MVDLIVAWDKLAQFQSADELAQFLTSEGVKANRQDAMSYAISVWMSGATGEKIITNTEATARFVLDKDGYEVYKHIAYHTPAMTEFVAEFDLGHYPALVNY